MKKLGDDAVAELKSQINPKVLRTMERSGLLREIDQGEQLRPFTLLKGHKFQGYELSSIRFLLNAMAYRQGMHDEGADDFLMNTVQYLHLPVMAVIHPKLDAVSIISDLVKDRFEASKNKLVRDTCNAAYFVEDMHKKHLEESGGHMNWLMQLASLHVPMAIALGKDRGEALAFLENSIRDGVRDLSWVYGKTDGMADGLLDHYLIAYPDLWPRFRRKASSFLGAPMIRDINRGRRVAVASTLDLPKPEFRKDPMVYRGPAGKSMVRVPNKRFPESLSTFVLDYLSGIDPDVLSANHLLLDGTRSRPWLKRAVDIDSRMDLVELLIKHGVDHPAIGRISDLSSKLSDEGCKDAIMGYLRRGSRVRQQTAKAALEGRPGLFGWALEQCASNAGMVRRLSDIAEIPHGSVEKMTSLTRRKLLTHELGI